MAMARSAARVPDMVRSPRADIRCSRGGETLRNGLTSESAQHRPFPGFAEVFGVGLPESPLAALVVKDEEIDTALMIADRHLAVYRTVEVYGSRIARYMSEEEQAVAVWFVVVPER